MPDPTSAPSSTPAADRHPGAPAAAISTGQSGSRDVVANPPEFELVRDAFGRLVLRIGEQVWENVLPVRAFPIYAPDAGVALISADGHERIWIDHLELLPGKTRQLIEADLASREFMPVIRRLKAVSGFATPSTWQVETDRGDTSFVLKGEEFIRRLTPTRLLITDAQGVHYILPDLEALDRQGRRIVDRFL